MFTTNTHFKHLYDRTHLSSYVFYWLYRLKFNAIVNGTLVKAVIEKSINRCALLANLVQQYCAFMQEMLNTDYRRINAFSLISMRRYFIRHVINFELFPIYHLLSHRKASHITHSELYHYIHIAELAKSSKATKFNDEVYNITH